MSASKEPHTEKVEAKKVPSEEAQAVTAPEKPSKKPKTRRRRLWRFMKRSVIALLLLALATRVALPFLLPGVLSAVGKSQGLSIRYDKLDLSILGGYFELWHLDVRPWTETGEEEADPLLFLEYAQADVDVSALLAGRLAVHRLEVDGLDAWIRRESADGWELEQLFATESTPEDDAAEEPTVKAKPEPKGPSPIQLGSPVEVSALRIQDVTVHVNDLVCDPPLDTSLALDVLVSDVGSKERPTHLMVQARCPQLLDLFLLEGKGQSAGQEAQLDLTLDLSTLQLHPLTTYLEPLGIRPHARHLDASFGLRVRTESANEDGSALALSLALSDMLLEADSVEAAALDTIRLEASSLSALGLTIEEALVKGVRGRAQRTPEGTLRVAGVELVTPAPSEPAPRKPKAVKEPSSTAEPFLFDLPEVRLEDFSFQVKDDGIVPATDLDLTLESLSLGPITNATATGDSARLDMRVLAPGIFEELTLGGDLAAFGDRRSFELLLAIEGIAPERVAPYLAAAGIESEFDQGRFQARFGGVLESDDQERLKLGIELTDVKLENGKELFSIARIGTSVIHDSKQAATIVESLELTGTRFPAERDAEGRIHALGLILGESPPTAQVAVGPPAPVADAPTEPGAATKETATPTPDSTTPTTPPTAPAGPTPSIEIRRVAWNDTVLSWRDLAVEPMFELALDDMGLELEGLVIGGENDDRPPATFDLWLASAAIGDEVRLAGTIDSRPGPLDLSAELEVSGKSLDLERFGPYLEKLSIEEQWEAAEFGLGVKVNAVQEPEALRASAELTNLHFTNQGEAVLSLASVSLPGIEVRPGEIRIDPVVVNGPELTLERDAGGGLNVLGLRLVPRPEEEVPEEDPSLAPPTPTPSKQAAPEPASTSATSIRLLGLQLEGTRVTWRDALVDPQVDTSLTVGASVGELVLGQDAQPADFSFTARVEDVLEELSLAGKLTLDPDRPRMEARLGFEGLQAGPLAAYLPASLPMVLEDGRFQVDLLVAVEPASEGGLGLRVEATELDFRDGPEGTSLLSMERMALVVPRLDTRAEVYAIDELVLEGLEIDARRTQPDRVEFLGFALVTGSTKLAQAESQGTPAAQPVSVQDTNAPQFDPSMIPAPLEEIIPTVTIGRLDLGIDRLGFIDETHPEAVPLSAHMHLTTAEPVTLLSPDHEDLPPIELTVLGGAEPLVAEIESLVTLSPWALEPGLDFTLEARGIRGPALIEMVPDLVDRVDATGLADGYFSTRASAHMRIRRRGPLALDFAAGFGFDLTVEDVGLRNEPDGDVLLGFEALYVDAKTIRPETGDIHFTSIELVEPRGFLDVTSEGIGTSGLQVRYAPSTTATKDVPAPEVPTQETESTIADGSEPVDEEATVPDEEAPAPVEPTSPPHPAGQEKPVELRIDRLAVTGIDFTIRDESYEPPMVLPLVGLDLEVKRFTTRSFTEPVPIQANLSLYGGDIDLPLRNSSTLVGGVLGAIGSAITFSGKGLKTERRPAFDEVTGRVNLTLFPKPEGSVRTSVRGLELKNFTGPALAGGVKIGDGVVNQNLRLRFEQDGTLRLDSQTDFSYLSLSEPPGGPISRYLKLPAPLDTVLFVMKDEQGDIRIPLSFTVPEGQVSVTKVTRRASALLLEIIGKALANTPMRIVGGVLDFTGIKKEVTVSLEGVERVTLDYGAGVEFLEQGDSSKLAPLLDLVRQDLSLVLVLEHTLGSEDLTRAEALANPSPADCEALAKQLRARKLRLTRLRDEAAASASAYYAIQDRVSGDRVAAEVRAIDADLGGTERALDDIFERLRPGAERGRAKRTRTAAVELAQARIDGLESFLLNQPITAISTRVDARRPRYQVPEGQATGHIIVTLRRLR